MASYSKNRNLNIHHCDNLKSYRTRSAKEFSLLYNERSIEWRSLQLEDRGSDDVLCGHCYCTPQGPVISEYGIRVEWWLGSENLRKAFPTCTPRPPVGTSNEFMRESTLSALRSQHLHARPTSRLHSVMYEVNAFMELNIRCHNGTERHDAADGRDVNAAANILNNQSRTTDGPPACDLGCGLTTSQRKNAAYYRVFIRIFRIQLCTSMSLLCKFVRRSQQFNISNK